MLAVLIRYPDQQSISKDLQGTVYVLNFCCKTLGNTCSSEYSCKTRIADQKRVSLAIQLCEIPSIQMLNNTLKRLTCNFLFLDTNVWHFL